MNDFQSTKLWLIELLSVSKDAAHVHIGLVVFLGVAILFRLPLRDWRPITAAILVALAGETWDVIETIHHDQPLPWIRGGHDLWNTLLWPFILFALARWTKVLKRQS